MVGNCWERGPSLEMLWELNGDQAPPPHLGLVARGTLRTWGRGSWCAGLILAAALPHLLKKRSTQYNQCNPVQTNTTQHPAWPRRENPSKPRLPAMPPRAGTLLNARRTAEALP